MVGAFDGSEGTFWIFKQKEDLGFCRNHWLPLTEHSPHTETRVCCCLLASNPHTAPQGILLLSQFRVEETEARVSRGGGAGPERRQPGSRTPTPTVGLRPEGCRLGWGGRNGPERQGRRLLGALLSFARVSQGLLAAAGSEVLRDLPTSFSDHSRKEREDQLLIVVSLAPWFGFVKK